jgi:hypothetical protein
MNAFRASTSALLVLALAGACATTRSVREEAQPSGFLGDYTCRSTSSPA